MRTADFPEKDMKKLFFIDNPVQGRLIPIYPVYDPDHEGEYDDSVKRSEWYNWKVNSNNRIYRDRGVPGQGLYFGKEPESNIDVSIRSVEFFVQTSLHPAIQQKIQEIVQDLMNIAAAISKMGFYQEIRSDTDLDVRRLLITEIEYIFAVSRSIYDLLQEIIKHIWERLELTEGGGNQLKQSFAGMALHGGDPIPAGELEEKYGLTPNLADFYASYAGIFSNIKSFRDDMIHYGKGIEMIHSTEKGYTVTTDQEPFCNFDAWTERDIISDAVVLNSITHDTTRSDVAPIWPPIAKAVLSVIEAMDDFVTCLKTNFTLPPFLAPDYDVYLRGHYLANLSKLSDIIEKDSWGNDIGKAMVEHLSK